MNINEIADRGNKHAKSKCFYFNDPRKAICEKIIDETEELFCAYGIDNTDIINVHGLISKDYVDDKNWIIAFEQIIKNSEGDELADIIITAAAGAKELGIDIKKHIAAKMKYNELREDHK